MAVLPKFAPFGDQGVEYAIFETMNAFNKGQRKFTIDGLQAGVNFTKDAEKALRENFPIKRVGGNVYKLEVEFDMSKIV